MSWLKSIGGNLSVAQIKEWRGQVVNMTREIVIEGTREFYNAHLPPREGEAGSNNQEGEPSSSAGESNLTSGEVEEEEQQATTDKQRAYVAADFVEDASVASGPSEFLEQYEHDSFVETQRVYEHSEELGPVRPSGSTVNTGEKANANANWLNNDQDREVAAQWTPVVVSEQQQLLATVNGNTVAENDSLATDRETSVAWQVDSEFEEDVKSKPHSSALTEVDLLEENFSAVASNSALPSDNFSGTDETVQCDLAQSPLAPSTETKLLTGCSSNLSRSWHQLHTPIAMHNTGQQTELPASVTSVEAQVQTTAKHSVEAETETETEIKVEIEKETATKTTLEVMSIQSQTDGRPEIGHQVHTQTDPSNCSSFAAQTEPASLLLHSETQTLIVPNSDCNHVEIQTDSDSLSTDRMQLQDCKTTSSVDSTEQHTQTQVALIATLESNTQTELQEPVRTSLADVSVSTDRVRCKAKKTQTETDEHSNSLLVENELLKQQLAQTEQLDNASLLTKVEKFDASVSTDFHLSHLQSSLACQTDLLSLRHAFAMTDVKSTFDAGVQKDVQPKASSDRSVGTELIVKLSQIACQTDRTDYKASDSQTDSVTLELVQKVDASVLTDGQLVEAEAFFAVRNACIQFQEQLTEMVGRDERAQLENERLKAHLVELDQTYTSSLSEAEMRERTLQRRATELQQQCELLSAQLESVLHQRDEALQNAQLSQQRANTSQQAVERLQTVIQVYEKEKQELVSAETERFNKDAKRLESDLLFARKEIVNLQEKIQKQQADLEASRRLSEQVYLKEKRISQLESEVENRDHKLVELHSQIDKLSRVSNQTIDRTLIKSLFLSYVNTPITKRIDVIRLMCNVLQCDENEQHKAIESERNAAGGAGWMSGLFSSPRSAAASSGSAAVSNDQSIAAFGKLFVEFLEHETEKKPQLKLPVEQMLQRHRLPSGSYGSQSQSRADLDRSSASNADDSLRPAPTVIKKLAELPDAHVAPAQLALDRYNDVIAEHLQSSRASPQQAPASNNISNI